jgi:hypothetical protein
MEELEAVDWYTQRIDASADPELRALLAHNRDEEQEHAAMVLEWLRRRDANFDRQLRRYLFTDGPIVREDDEAGRDGDGQSRAFDPVDSGLGIGALHEEATL